MLDGNKVVVVMPAYNAETTLEKTVAELPSTVDHIIVVDDRSSDNTQKVAKKLGVDLIVHDQNLGYGGNQKTCYQQALNAGADIVIMVHPDYQYSPRLVNAMAAMLTSEHYDIVLASRIIGDQRSRIRSMPWWRYYANRSLTLIQNIALPYKLSEYHTGYRAYTRKFLETIPINRNSNDFVFDNELLVQARYFRFRIGEISCPTRYHEDASSINFSRSVKYGFGVLNTTLKYKLDKWGIKKSALFTH